jgi:hypothetical protein
MQQVIAVMIFQELIVLPFPRTYSPAENIQAQQNATIAPNQGRWPIIGGKDKYGNFVGHVR